MPHGLYHLAARIGLILISLWVSRQIIHYALPRLARVKIPMNLRDRILMRYQQKDFGAWMFAWFKTGLDPMFLELPDLLKPLPNVRCFLDLGCGFGIAGCFLLEWYPQAIAYAIDPTPHRVAGAAGAMGDRGKVFVGSAPDFERPELPPKFDAIFTLDMIHFLSDAELDLTLSRLRAKLEDGQYLILRTPIRPDHTFPLRRRFSYLFSKLTGTFTVLRTAQQVRERISKSDFHVVLSQQSGDKPDLVWFIAAASPVQNVDRDCGDQQQHNHRVNYNHRGSVPGSELVQLLEPAKSS